MNDSRRSMLRMRLLALAVLLAAFAAGGITGVAYERTVSAGEAGPPPPRHGGRRGPPPNIFAAGGPLADRLDLSPEQSRRIQEIVNADRVKAQATFEEIEPLLRARFDSTQTAIEAVLTEEQRAEFRRLQQERRTRLRGALRR